MKNNLCLSRSSEGKKGMIVKMEKKDKRILILSIIICLLPMALGIAFYDKMPEQMPIHFNMRGEVDNYGPKNLVLFGIPVFMAIIQTICMTFTIKELKNEEEPIIFKIMEWFIPIITVLLYILMLKFTLGDNVCIVLNP